MRRIILLFAIALVMAAMMLVTAVPAFAKVNDFGGETPGESNVLKAGGESNEGSVVGGGGFTEQTNKIAGGGGHFQGGTGQYCGEPSPTGCDVRHGEGSTGP